MWKSIMHSTAQCLLRAALLYPNTAEGITDNQSNTLDLIGRLLVPQLYPSWNFPNTNNTRIALPTQELWGTHSSHSFY